MSDVILSRDEIEALTGYKVSTKQLETLRTRGFHRAFINRAGAVVLERSHYETVVRGEAQNAAHTKRANLSIFNPRAA